MNEDQFKEYVRKHEARYLKHPALFRLRIVFIILSGNLNIIILFLLAAGLGWYGYKVVLIFPLLFIVVAAFAVAFLYYGIQLLKRMVSLKFQKP